MSKKKLGLILFVISIFQLLIFYQGFGNWKYHSAVWAVVKDSGVRTRESDPECCSAEAMMKDTGTKTQEPVYNTLPKYGKKCWIGENYYFIYAFDKTPKMGTAILKIQIFDKNGRRNTELNITGNYGMPSMGSAHDSGEQSFKLNKKGDYLLPVDIAMPGEWEVKITFTKEKKTFYLGKFKFNV